MINNSIIYKFFKDFTNRRKKTDRGVVFSSRPFPNILKYRGPPIRPSNNLENKTLLDILKSSASVYKSSTSQFFRTITGIQSGPDAFDESRFIMTFLTILGVIEILCSFRLVLEGKTGK